MDVLFHPETGLIFWSLVSFLLLFVLLKKLAFKPILGMMEKRENKIKESLSEAEKTRLEAEKLFTDYQKQIENARKEAQVLIDEGKKVAEKMKQEIVTKAEEEVKHMTERSRAETELQKERAFIDLQGKVADLAVSAASKVVGKVLSEKDHVRLVEESITDLRNLKELTAVIESERNALIDASDESGEGKIKGEVITALPVSKELEKKTVSQLEGLIGKNIDLTFSVDESIIGGAIFKIGDRVIDGSAKRKLDNLEKSLAEMGVKA